MNFSGVCCGIFFGITLPLWVAAVEVALGQSASDLYRITDGRSGAVSAFHQVSVPKGEETVLAKLEGPGKVTYFYITDDTVGKWYPGLVLKVFWDDATEPSICVPLADFFGAVAGRAVDYESAMMQINHACFMCYLPMPFSKGARFVLGNDGDRDYSQKVAFGDFCRVGRSSLPSVAPVADSFRLGGRGNRLLFA